MSVIDDYLDTVTPPEHEALERLRRLIHEVAPGAEEVISYGMPGFKYKGKYLAGFYAFKNHLSLFPTGIPEAIVPKLEGFTLSKGTVQFTLDKPIPENLVKELVQARANDIDRA